MGTEELSAAYDAANDAFHDNPNDETAAARKQAADALAAARSEERVTREAEAVSMDDGSPDGVAQPGSVEGSTEVNQ